MIHTRTKIKPDWWVRYAMGQLNELWLEGFHISIIAGGAVRDYELNRPPNDIDIYVIGGDSESLHNLEYQRYQRSQSGSFGAEGGLGDIQHIEATFNKTMNYPAYEMNLIFNLIKIKDDFMSFESEANKDKRIEFAGKILKTFDFGINKAAIVEIDMNLNNEPITTQVHDVDFSSDIRYQTLTIRIEDYIKYNNLKRLPMRSRKIRGYFPNHHIQIL